MCERAFIHMEGALKSGHRTPDFRVPGEKGNRQRFIGAFISHSGDRSVFNHMVSPDQRGAQIKLMNILCPFCAGDLRPTGQPLNDLSWNFRWATSMEEALWNNILSLRERLSGTPFLGNSSQSSPPKKHWTIPRILVVRYPIKVE